MIYFKYLWTVLKHKYYVGKECFRMGLYWRGLVHDISKLYPSEFFAYAGYFYKDKNKYCIKFSKAWAHHFTKNKHHWEYWLSSPILEYNKIETMSDLNTMFNGASWEIPEMPKVFVKEMVCDWIGAGIVYSGKRDLKEWYDKNKNKIRLNLKTRELVDRLVQENI